MNKKRVVVTGIGVVSSIGIGKEEFWQANLEGKSGIDLITSFDTKDYPSKIASQIKNFNPLQFMTPDFADRADRFSQLALASAKLALEDAKLNLDKIDKERMGVIIGSGLGGVIFHEEQIITMINKGSKRANPIGVPKVSPNSSPAVISIYFKLEGINLAISTACSSGTNAIGCAFEFIKEGKADLVLAGGTEAPLTPYTFASFCSLRVLSKRNNHPQEASRPFDRKRDGCVLGEGSACLVLEELNHALKRSAHIYCEILSYSCNCGAYHLVMPRQDAQDAARCMREAIKRANLKPEDIDYINAHGTSTPQNDRVETKAIKEVFAEYAYKIPISSTKSMIGHTLGAAGAIEAAVSSLVIENQIIPPTINYKYPDPECDLDYVPNKPRKAKVKTVLSNSFGFGSNNACLVFRKYDG